jgi:hypothetical protein
MRDGADELAQAIHGRDAKARDLMGGSNAALFRHALERLRLRDERIAALELELASTHAALVRRMADLAAAQKRIEELEARAAPKTAAQRRAARIAAGKARAAALTPERRQEIARLAAAARWSKP